MAKDYIDSHEGGNRSADSFGRRYRCISRAIQPGDHAPRSGSFDEGDLNQLDGTTRKELVDVAALVKLDTLPALKRRTVSMNRAQNDELS